MWQAMNLQLILFPEDAQAGRNANWWEQVTGSDEFERTQKKHEQIDDGQYGDFGLILNIGPFKTAWTLGVRLNPDTAIDAIATGFPTLGDFEVVGDTFRGLMNGWLNDNCPPIRRLAFATDLIVKHASPEAAHNHMSAYLPINVDAETTDFQYRINRKQPSTAINGLLLNKLRTWSIAKLEIVADIVGTGQNVGNHVAFASRLQLDINTDQGRKDILPQELISAQFAELMELAKDIATNGDGR